jgi:hypothetical protein
VPAGLRPTALNATPRVPGALLSSITAIAGTADIGAFAQRSLAIAPPRISLRTPEAAGAEPAIPRSARELNTRSEGAGSTTGTPGSRQPSGAEMVIRRSLAGTAEALFRSLHGTSPQVPAAALRSIDSPLQEGETAMGPDTSGHAGPPGDFAGPHQVIRRYHDNSSVAQAGSRVDFDHSPAEAMTSRDLDELIDRIVAKLERRVVADLERRSRRNLPGVF